MKREILAIHLQLTLLRKKEYGILIRSKLIKLNVNANKLNNSFAEYLKNYKLRDGFHFGGSLGPKFELFK